MERTEDITQQLISNDFLIVNLGLIFPDAIFLNLEYKIVQVSVSIQHSLGYIGESICGQSISFLSDNENLEELFRKELQPGFFSELPVNLKSIDGGSVQYMMSGFYLGLISDFANFIVIRGCNRQEVNKLSKQLNQAQNQVDNFIYRAAHDLRGPLATIQGLVNLIKARKDDSEIDRFIHMVDSHSQQLDERLSNLTYLTQPSNEESAPSCQLNFYDLETHLRKILEKNAFVDFLEFNFYTETSKFVGINEVLLYALLTHLFLYILSLPKSKRDITLIMSCEIAQSQLTIRLRANGFLVDDVILSKIQGNTAHLYSDLLKHSKLSNIMAAQKVAHKLNATMLADATSNEDHQLVISIPANKARCKTTVGTTYSIFGDN